MTSLEKARAAIAEIMDADDDQLRQLCGPFPLFMVRGALPFVPRILPDDPAELDAQIDRAQAFINWLRSDDTAELTA